MQNSYPKFSLLISIYCKESSTYFDRAMQSIWTDQTVKPSEIILIEDGVLTDQLYQSIDNWKKELGDIFKVFSLKENVGIGKAKRIGLEKCSNDLIAIMDTDDISLPDRFKKQLAVFKIKDVDVCGAWIGEFKNNEIQIISYRRVPETQQDILKFAKRRSPVNNVTAMYKRAAVLNVGSYTEYRTSEDYNLWVRMMMNGAKFYNIQESLVSVRINNGQLEGRRSGFNYVANEIKLQYDFLTMKFISPYVFIQNLVIRIPVRLLPNKLLSFVYKIIRH